MRKHHCLGALAAIGLIVGAIAIPTQVAAVGVGKSCGGFLGKKCDKGLWCEQKPGRCGGAKTAGTCIKPPQICTKQYKPVCGCNGKTYGNDCERRAAKAQKKHDGRCKK